MRGGTLPANDVRALTGQTPDWDLPIADSINLGRLQILEVSQRAEYPG